MSSVSSVNSTPSSTLSTNPSSSTGVTPALTITGLASGIDTNAIIQQLVAVQHNQITTLQNQQSTITNEETTFQQIESDLLALQNDASSLSNSINGIFDSRSVASSDQTVATGAASADATPGVYSFKVDSLAQAQVIASQGYTSPASTITQGTFGFQVGSGPVTSVTIDGSNNTLQGLASAINASGGGVTASVVNDGSGSQPYRLLLASNATGTANAINITSNLGADSGGAFQPVLTSTYIGAAAAGAANTGTSAATSNAGAGNYTGAGNQTYTFKVVGSGGTVGTTSGLSVKVLDSSNNVVTTLDVGSDYTPGTALTVASGVTVAFGAGTLNSGDSFTVDAYSPNVQAAANASVTVGSGPGALTVASSTNQLNNVIPGVTVNLLAANPSENVSLTVAANTSSISTAIQNFVTDYNTVVSAINTATSFNSTTNTGGPLLGNSDVSSIQSQLAIAAGGVVPGLSKLNNLTAIGITANADGTLSLNSSTLSNVLNGSVPGVSLGDVKNLFTLSGQSNVPGVQFVAGGNNTVASATPYQLVITQAATQGSVTGTAALTGSAAITSSNNTLTFSADGGSAQTITIPAGTYTPQQLANVIQAQVTANTALSASNVQVSLSGGQLTITSSTYGTSSVITVSGGTALATLGLTSGQTGGGLNVAGHFVVGGNTEAATGSGQLLTGNSGNTNTSGLEVQVSLTPSQVAANPSINLTVSRGIASTLGQTLNGLTDPTTGRLQTITQNFQDQIQTIQNNINNINSEISQQESQLTAQFAAMEGIISQLKNESSVISTLAQDNVSPFAASGSSSSSSGSGISFPSSSSSGSTTG
jgi:flagellar hook-associated protein 2